MRFPLVQLIKSTYEIQETIGNKQYCEIQVKKETIRRLERNL